MKQLPKKKPRLRFYILTPLALLLAVIISAFIYGFLFEQHQRADADMMHLRHMAEHSYQELLEAESGKLVTALSLLQDNKTLQKAFLARDRKKLLQHATPTFQEVFNINHITHFYFHGPDRVNFLRVHQPNRFGDTIERVTLRYAEATNKLQSGIELGPLGTFTLRAVAPWYEGERLIGYLELGIEMQHLFDHVTEITGTDIAITVDKQFLNRQAWESGMKMLGRVPDWDRLPSSVIAGQTLESIPSKVLGGRYSDMGTQPAFDNRHYQMITMPLRDAGNRKVGRIFYFQDITSMIDRAQRGVSIVVLFSIMFGVVIFIFFYVLTGRVETRLKTAQLKIIDDSKQREALQAGHVVELKQEISARKEAENLQSDTNAHLQHLLIASPAVIYACQASGDYAVTFVSENVQKMLGYEAQEFVDDPAFWRGHVHPDDRERVLKGLSNVFDTDKYVYEYRFMAKNGDYHWIHNGLQLVRDANGEPMEIAGYWVDITEQKKIELGWKEAQQRLLLHFEQTPMGVIEWNEDFEVLAWNPAAEKIFGYRKEEIMGDKSFGTIVPKEAEEQVDKVWQDLLSRKGSSRRTNTNVTKDGRQIYCDWYNTVLTDTNGKVIGVISLIEDITELQSLELARLRSEVKYRTLFESSGDAIMTLDPDNGLFADCNVATLSMFGCASRDEFLSKTPADFSPPVQPDGTDSMSLAKQRIATAVRQGSNQFEWLYTRLDGTEFPAHVLLTLVEMDDKHVIQATVRDITESKRAEATVQRVNRTLKTMVECHNVLIYSQDAEKLQQDICRILVEKGNYLLAWVGYSGAPPEKNVDVITCAGERCDYLNDVTIHWDDGQYGIGPTGAAIRTGKPQIVRDTSKANNYSPWHTPASERGFQSSAAIPLKDKEQVYGALNIYAAMPDAFDKDEMTLLEDLAEDLSYGLRTLRYRKQRNRATQALSDTLLETVDAIARTVEKRDPYTAGHQNRVAQLAVAIATRMGLDEEQIKGLRLGAIIHDIGKIYVPAEILSRPGELSENEFAMIQSHTQVGYDIIQDVHFPWPVKEMILQHHERLDGTGYPQGLKGDEIILEAKIIAVADIVEAINSYRPYRPALGIDKALTIIREQAGTGLDENIVNICVALFEEGEFEWE